MKNHFGRLDRYVAAGQETCHPREDRCWDQSWGWNLEGSVAFVEDNSLADNNEALGQVEEVICNLDFGNTAVLELILGAENFEDAVDVEETCPGIAAGKVCQIAG